MFVAPDFILFHYAAFCLRLSGGEFHADACNRLAVPYVPSAQKSVRAWCFEAECAWRARARAASLLHLLPSCLLALRPDCLICLSHHYYYYFLQFH